MLACSALRVTDIDLFAHVSVGGQFFGQCYRSLNVMSLVDRCAASVIGSKFC